MIGRKDSPKLSPDLMYSFPSCNTTQTHSHKIKMQYIFKREVDWRLFRASREGKRMKMSLATNSSHWDAHSGELLLWKVNRMSTCAHGL